MTGPKTGERACAPRYRISHPGANLTQRCTKLAADHPERRYYQVPEPSAVFSTAQGSAYACRFRCAMSSSVHRRIGAAIRGSSSSVVHAAIRGGRVEWGEGDEEGREPSRAQGCGVVAACPRGEAVRGGRSESPKRSPRIAPRHGNRARYVSQAREEVDSDSSAPYERAPYAGRQAPGGKVHAPKRMQSKTMTLLQWLPLRWAVVE